MTAAFGAMNDVHGAYFDADSAEELDQDAAAARARRYAGQFIFDAQTHHVRPTYGWEYLTNMRRWTQGQNPWSSVWNPAVLDIPAELDNYKFDAYIKDLFLDSDTTLATSPLHLRDAELDAVLSDESCVARSHQQMARSAGSWPRAVLAGTP